MCSEEGNCKLIFISILEENLNSLHGKDPRPPRESITGCHCSQPRPIGAGQAQAPHPPPSLGPPWGALGSQGALALCVSLSQPHCLPWGLSFFLSCYLSLFVSHCLCSSPFPGPWGPLSCSLKGGPGSRLSPAPGWPWEPPTSIFVPAGASGWPPLSRPGPWLCCEGFQPGVGGGRPAGPTASVFPPKLWAPPGVPLPAPPPAGRCLSLYQRRPVTLTTVSPYQRPTRRPQGGGGRGPPRVHPRTQTPLCTGTRPEGQGTPVCLCFPVRRGPRKRGVCSLVRPRLEPPARAGIGVGAPITPTPRALRTADQRPTSD